MEEHVEHFIRYLAAERGYADNTLSAYRNDLRQFYLFVANTRPDIVSWALVDLMLIQAYVLDLKARAYSPSSVARKIAALKSFYYYLAEKRVVAVNPTIDLEPPRVTKVPPRALSAEQVTALLNAPAEPTPKGLRDRAMLEVMYATGLRVTELVTLQLEDYEPGTSMLTVGQGAHERTISLTEPARAALDAYLAHARAALGAPTDDGVLFANPRGEPLTRQGIWLILKQYVARAGIAASVTPHSLRHAFAVHRLEQGASLQDVQRLLGHAHLSTTHLYSRTQLPALTPSSKIQISEHTES